MAVNETLAFGEIVNEIYPLLADKLSPLIGIVRILGIAVIVYLVILIIKGINSIRTARRIKRIEQKLDLLISLQQKKIKKKG